MFLNVHYSSIVANYFIYAIQAKHKIKMKEEEIIYIKIPFKKVWEKQENGSWKGYLGFTFEDTTGRIKDVDGKEVGSVSGGLGGRINLRIVGEKKTELTANPIDIWNAYVEAISKTELKI